VPAANLNLASGQRLRILAVKLSSFGDIIHATGAFRALRNWFPQAEIVLAVEQRWADVVRYNPNLNSLIESSSCDQVSLPYLAEIRRRLSKERGFDLAIDFQGNRRSAAWIYLSGARVKVGRGRYRPGWQLAMQPDPKRHAVEVCADICRGAGIFSDNFDPEIHTSPEEERSLDAFLDAEGIAPSGFVLVNPFSRWNSKSWPDRNVAEFIQRLAQSFDHAMILTGGVEDRARSERILHSLSCEKVTSLAGRLSLGQALCLYRRARLMVSCDSGPMHAAAAFGVPVVALFGPTFPERTGPWGPNHRVLQAARPAKHSAYRTDFAGTYIRALDTSTVFAAVAEELSSEFAPACLSGL
jgi:heptosyltransferase I